MDLRIVHISGQTNIFSSAVKVNVTQSGDGNCISGGGVVAGVGGGRWIQPLAEENARKVANRGGTGSLLGGRHRKQGGGHVGASG